MTASDADADPAQDSLLHANGIDALTGMPAVSPIAPDDAIRRDPSTPREPASAGRIAKLLGLFTKKFHGLPEELELKANDPASVGWAVVFASDVPDQVRQALDPLIAHRRDHTGVPAHLLKVLEFTPGGTLDDWLRKLGAHRADVDPARLPFYVMFVGEPASIPFELQAELDVAYAVGRLCFERAEDYRRYAESVIAYESASAPPHGRDVAFWSTRNRADRATQLSADCLVKPLAEGIPASGSEPAVKPIAEVRGFRARYFERRRSDSHEPGRVRKRSEPRCQTGVPFHRLARARLAEGPRAPGCPARRPPLPGLARARYAAGGLALLDRCPH